ncbi:hypothetical protein EMPG_12427 [Blastomyces silverae]|uniref:Phytocyanin domain-containing protein n=1 Tax=Blastomyces silverae TaxID=2060906 RepID=A0A0H1BTZ4_9EURO|nr:hypothetical protein EMPG_12427 [Blastomyces silverae]
MKSIINIIAFVAVASAGTIDVDVGDGALTFHPNKIRAEVGDEVVFHYFPRNHDVASGPFDAPCTPSDNGIYSGLINIDGSQPDATFTVRINNTTPIWLYCSTRGHCQGGMSAVINPPAGENTLEAYKAAARNAQSVRPEQVRGGIFRENGGANQSGSGSGMPSSTPTPTGTGGATTSPTSTPGAASSLFSDRTMLFNIFAAIVAGGAGFIGIL